jgi:hypothetical protein
MRLILFVSFSGVSWGFYFQVNSATVPILSLEMYNRNLYGPKMLIFLSEVLQIASIMSNRMTFFFGFTKQTNKQTPISLG